MNQNSNYLPAYQAQGAMVNAAHPPPADERLNSPEVVGLESTITIRDLETDDLEEYTLVHPDHADILQNRISTFTPIGRAVFGAREGDIVEVEGPTGAVRIQIASIHR